MQEVSGSIPLSSTNFVIFVAAKLLINTTKHRYPYPSIGWADSGCCYSSLHHKPIKKAALRPLPDIPQTWLHLYSRLDTKGSIKSAITVCASRLGCNPSACIHCCFNAMVSIKKGQSGICCSLAIFGYRSVNNVV